MEVLGTAATVRTDSPGALLRGRIERMHRSCLILTFGGGTNEIQRDIIGMVALGLPRVEPVRTAEIPHGLSRRLKPPTTSAAWCAPSPNRCARPSASASSTGSTSASTATCGPSSATPTSCPPRRRSRWAAAVSACSSRSRCWSRSAGRWPRCPTWSRPCSPRARWRSSAPRNCSRRGRCPRSTATRSSPSRSTATWARVPSRRPANGDGYRLTGTRTQVFYGPRRRRFPGARRNRFGHQGLRGRQGRCRA